MDNPPTPMVCRVAQVIGLALTLPVLAIPVVLALAYIAALVTGHLG